MPTDRDLYRNGNKTSPRMDNVRDKDVTIYQKDGKDWVQALSGGISVYAYNQVPSGNNWWKLPAGSNVPEGLNLTADLSVPGHWLFEPDEDMPLDEYKKSLTSTNKDWKPTWKLLSTRREVLNLAQFLVNHSGTIALPSEEIMKLSPKSRRLIAAALTRQIEYHQSVLAQENISEDEASDHMNDLALYELIRKQFVPGSSSFLSQANAVGQGFNIYGTFSTDSLIRPLFNFQKAGMQTFTFLGVEYEIPAIVNGIEDTASYYVSGTALSRDELQNSLAAHAKVEASYGAFSGAIEATYTSEYEQSSEYYFSYNNFYSQLAYLQINPDTEFLSDDFKTRLSELPGSVSPENLHVFEDFFNTFGIYFTSKIVLGASLSFYVSTQKVSQLSKQDIDASINAEYNGLYTSGSIAADVQTSTQWKSYTENSQVSISSLGADPVKGGYLAKLSEAERFQPTAATVEAFNAWLDTIKTDPKIVDFGLTGIWELCGNRRKVVQEAWDLYGRSMRPKLVINTSTTLYPGQPYNVPTITIGRLIQPDKAPANGMGYQVVVLKGDITKPESTIFNRYYSIDANTWFNSFRNLYQEMATDLKQYNEEGNILILSSFNLNWDAPPTPDFLSLIRSAGAGEKITQWVSNSDPGSAVGNPINVMLVGIFGQGTDTGVEFVQRYADTTAHATPAQLEVLFYKRTDGSGYTLSQDELG
jgi:hypothetical protein